LVDAAGMFSFLMFPATDRATRAALALELQTAILCRSIISSSSTAVL
jgi:hypothetical protein